MRIVGELPGTPPDGPEPTLEWVEVGTDVMGALRARLGSDPDADANLVAVLMCLRGWLQRDTWEAVLDELPWPLRGVLRSPQQLPPVPRLTGRDGLVAMVADLAQHAPAAAAFYVGAVFATLRTHLPRGLADAVAQELPRDVAEIWTAAK